MINAIECKYRRVSPRKCGQNVIGKVCLSDLLLVTSRIVVKVVATELLVMLEVVIELLPRDVLEKAAGLPASSDGSNVDVVDIDVLATNDTNLTHDKDYDATLSLREMIPLQTNESCLSRLRTYRRKEQLKPVDHFLILAFLQCDIGAMWTAHQIIPRSASL